MWERVKFREEVWRVAAACDCSVCSRIVGQPGTRVPGATISTGSEPGTHVPGAVSPAESHALTGWLVYFNSDNKRELGPMI